jgi:hypothetical protein
MLSDRRMAGVVAPVLPPSPFLYGRVTGFRRRSSATPLVEAGWHKWDIGKGSVSA